MLYWIGGALDRSSELPWKTNVFFLCSMADAAIYLARELLGVGHNHESFPATFLLSYDLMLHKIASFSLLLLLLLLTPFTFHPFSLSLFSSSYCMCVCVCVCCVGSFLRFLQLKRLWWQKPSKASREAFPTLTHSLTLTLSSPNRIRWGISTSLFHSLSRTRKNRRRACSSS